MRRSNSAPKPLLFQRTAYSLALHKALTKFLGNAAGRMVAYKQLANDSGVDEDRIRRAAKDPDSGQWRPLDPEELLSIAAALGPSFTSSILGHLGQGAFRLPDAKEAPLTELAADAVEAAAAVSRAATGRDSPLLKLVGERMMQGGAMLLKMETPDGQVFYQEKPN